MSLLDSITNINMFLVQSRYFVMLLIFITVLRLFVSLMKRRDKSLTLSNIVNSKYSYLLLTIALVQTLLVIPPVSGKGTDSWYMMYVVNTMKTEGINVMFRTDRPVVSYITYMVGEFLNVPGRISVPITGILFSTFYVFSIFVFTYALTKNVGLGSIASLLTANTNAVKQLSLCFIWNLLGLSLLLLFFSAVLKSVEKEKAKCYGCLAVTILGINFFVHEFSVIICNIVLLVFTCLTFFRRSKIMYKLGLLLSVCIGLTVLLIAIIPIYGTVIYDAGINRMTFGSILQFKFMEELVSDWTSEYLWIFIFSIVGAFFVLWNKSKIGDFITSWVVGVIIILLFTVDCTDRIYLYLPLSILSVMGFMYFIEISSRYNKKKVTTKIFLIFLILAPCVFFGRTAHMNIRYFKRGPFYWDTKYIEQEHLTWISENYDLQKIVVMTDVEWFTPISETSYPKLMGGFHYRLLSEIGNNIYVGRVANLLLEKPDNREGTSLIKALHHPEYLGFYSSLNVDWVLENKTIIVATTIYNIQPLEREILCRTEMEGIYVIKDLVEREKIEWLTKWLEQ